MSSPINKLTASSLIENLNSDFIEAQNFMKSNREPKVIKVYVESDDDIAYWNTVLTSIIKNSKKFKFEVDLPIKNGNERGKQSALNLFKSNLGKHLILCLDSDYDYLLPNRTENTKLLNDSDFIFHTYAYSIENLHSYHESLNNFCIQCVKKTDICIDLNTLLLKYSNLIYELFCWNVFLYHLEKEKYFTISDFSDTIKVLNNNSDIDNGFESAFSCLGERINKKMEELNELFSDLIKEKEDFKDYLTHKGVTPDNCYLYVNGHSILENVVLMFMKPVVKKAKSDKLQEIFSSECSSELKENYKNHYLNKASKEGNLIREIYSNYNFFEISEFLKTKSDLKRYEEKYLD
ncbi:hypothetical protein BV902_01025 [Sphingobacterium sp. B29]|uniref:DUF4435 domain-containing protein n=1 Tax=Sphingobacterium sp. B29 TaxID=1933220 RepID=UPI0009580FFF|nr:DUF4435 domain-containing protein [Sphingobacterium sp. B29]APU95083.1 hypothetical protein BV902_01025 [Sphingobacterium sp. B29]